MVTFKDVFSITWKVVLSLMIVSAIVGVAYWLLSVPGKLAKVAKANTTVEAMSTYDTSDYHTKMPKSLWERRAAWAVKHRCSFAGMSKEEVIRALGRPTEEKTYALTYTWETKDCARYDGDACAEYKKESNIIFLHNGYSQSFRYGDEDCHTLSGEHQYLGLKIPKDPAQEDALQKAKAEFQAKLAAQQVVEQKQLEQERDAERKRLAGLRAECTPFIDGSPEKIQAKKMPLPPRECREILSWMRDAYLNALYDLQKQS